MLCHTLLTFSLVNDVKFMNYIKLLTQDWSLNFVASMKHAFLCCGGVMGQNDFAFVLDILFLVELTPNVLLQNSLNFLMLQAFKIGCSKGISKIKNLNCLFSFRKLVDIYYVIFGNCYHIAINQLTN